MYAVGTTENTSSMFSEHSSIFHVKSEIKQFFFLFGYGSN
jgi:hypothetical protein